MSETITKTVNPEEEILRQNDKALNEMYNDDKSKPGGIDKKNKYAYEELINEQRTGYKALQLVAFNEKGNVVAQDASDKSLVDDKENKKREKEEWEAIHLGNSSEDWKRTDN